MSGWITRTAVPLPFAVLLGVANMEATQFVTGSTRAGSDYAFAVPDNWNGDLIIYGHGIVDPGVPVVLPTTQDGFRGHYYTPTGAISSPMLTLHTTRDPVVPLFHETIYAGLAPADLLVQRTVDRFGHCAFNQQEVLTAFDDLVGWVTEGTRPVGGDATIR